MSNWSLCRKILCVRADNMGDVIMSGPSMRALKESFGSSITLLTSSMGKLITSCIPFIDHTLVYDLPWVKADQYLSADGCLELLETLRTQSFDAAVIFTTYSQSALPAAMLTFLAGIPLRLAYCRENPYGLLTDWVPDKEPYEKIVHQVERDLHLVQSVGAETSDKRLSIRVRKQAKKDAWQKLKVQGIAMQQPFIIVHTGVSEEKRKYPAEYWPPALQLLQEQLKMPLLLTGSAADRPQAEWIQGQTGGNVYVVAGLLSIEEFVALVHEAALVMSVNTGAVHIAAAAGTPVVVLYALTNPQHTPWQARARVLPFPVPEHLRSKNEVVSYVSSEMHRKPVAFPEPEDIVRAAAEVLQSSIARVP